MNTPEDQRKAPPNSAPLEDSKKHAPTYKKQKSRRDTFMEDLMAGVDSNLEKLRKSAKSMKRQGEA